MRSMQVKSPCTRDKNKEEMIEEKRNKWKKMHANERKKWLSAARRSTQRNSKGEQG